MKRTAAVLLVSVLMIAAELFSGINGIIEKNRPYEFELHRELIEKSDTRYIERLTLSTIVDPGHFALSPFSFGMNIEDFNDVWNSDYPPPILQLHDAVTDERIDLPVEPYGGGLRSVFSLTHLSSVTMAAYVTQFNADITAYTIDASLEMSSVPNRPVLKTFHDMFHVIERE